MLTFEQIKKECVPMQHLLVNEKGVERLYLGYTSSGSIIVEDLSGYVLFFRYENYSNWTIKPYTPPKKTKMVTMYQLVVESWDEGLTYEIHKPLFSSKELAEANMVLYKAIGTIAVQVEVVE